MLMLGGAEGVAGHVGEQAGVTVAARPPSPEVAGQPPAAAAASQGIRPDSVIVYTSDTSRVALSYGCSRV